MQRKYVQRKKRNLILKEARPLHKEKRLYKKLFCLPYKKHYVTPAQSNCIQKRAFLCKMGNTVPKKRPKKYARCHNSLILVDLSLKFLAFLCFYTSHRITIPQLLCFLRILKAPNRGTQKYTHLPYTTQFRPIILSWSLLLVFNFLRAKSQANILILRVGLAF